MKTEEEKTAIDAYTIGGRDSEINWQLRQPPRFPDMEISEIIEQIDSAMEKSDADSDMVVFRNFGDFEFEVGDDFIDKGFSSCTLDLQIARQWSGKNIGRLTIEKFSHCIPVNLVGEQEILLPRGTHFDVIGIGADGIYELEII